MRSKIFERDPIFLSWSAISSNRFASSSDVFLANVWTRGSWPRASKRRSLAEVNSGRNAPHADPVGRGAGFRHTRTFPQHLKQRQSFKAQPHDNKYVHYCKVQSLTSALLRTSLHCSWSWPLTSWHNQFEKLHLLFFSLSFFRLKDLQPHSALVKYSHPKTTNACTFDSDCVIVKRKENYSFYFKIIII